MLSVKDHKRQKKKMEQIKTLEYKHRENLDRAYMLYSVLRDLYKRGLKRKMCEQVIASDIAKEFSTHIYEFNKDKLEESYKIASKLLRLVKECNTNVIISGLVDDNRKYIKRVIDLFRELIINNNLSKLKYEIRLEKEDLKKFNKDFN